MSDTVDNVLNTVNESEPSEDVVVNEETPVEAPVEEAPVEEAAEPVEEAPVASASETEAAEPEVEEPVSVEEVVQNVQEILTTPVNEDLSDKERIVHLETRVDGLINLLRSVYKQSEVDDVKIWRSDFNSIREELNNV